MPQSGCMQNMVELAGYTASCPRCPNVVGKEGHSMHMQQHRVVCSAGHSGMHILHSAIQGSFGRACAAVALVFQSNIQAFRHGSVKRLGACTAYNSIKE